MSVVVERCKEIVKQTFLGFLLATLGGSCMAHGGGSAGNDSAGSAAPERKDPKRSEREEREERFDWHANTFSPQPGAPNNPWLAELATVCGRSDAALGNVADRAARHQARARSPLDVSIIGFALRTEGAPYVWPRVWSIEGALERQDVAARMRHWLTSFDDGGERRCGVGMAQREDGDVVVTAVAADVLADLRPLPSQVRTGQWLDVDATLLGGASQAKVVVLGPSGAPYTVPTTLNGSEARARVHADRPGTWLLQLLATNDNGPRPVLEAVVHVDELPPSTFAPQRVPGEEAGMMAPDDRTALEWMVREARARERRPPLHRDARLDRVAQTHAEAMQAARRVAHDVGDGDPGARVQAAGLDVRIAGENVARALTLNRAHRALWASPSHRSNLLDPRFEAVGIGIVRDPDGTVWAAEVFADFR